MSSDEDFIGQPELARRPRSKRKKEMTEHIEHGPKLRAFWAVEKRSKSGIAHLVTAESTVLLGRETSDNPFFYWSECGRRYAFWDIRTIIASGITAPRCKRCMASKYATWLDERRAVGSKITNLK